MPVLLAFLRMSLIQLVVLLAIAPAAQASDWDRVIFAGMDVDFRSTFASSGGKISLPVNEARAFVLGVAGMSLSDMRLANRGKMDSDRVGANARLLFGLERGFGSLFASGSIGLSFNRYVTRNGEVQNKAGVAGLVDIWFKPDERQYYHAAALGDSGSETAWSRLRYGYRPAILPAFIGPEVAVNVSPTTRKFHLGAHISEVKFGPATFALSAGQVWDYGRQGQYVTLTGYMRY